MDDDFLYSGRKNNQYVSAKELYEEYNKSLQLGKCSDKLLLYFRRIAKRFASTFEYVNKADADAVVEYAVAEAWQKWDTFDPQKTNNIFSFYTTMLANDMKLHYKQLTKGKNLNISIESLFTPKD